LKLSEEMKVALRRTRDKWQRDLETVSSFSMEGCSVCKQVGKDYPKIANRCRKCPVLKLCDSTITNKAYHPTLWDKLLNVEGDYLELLRQIVTELNKLLVEAEY